MRASEAHQKGVRKTAKNLKNDGWNVKAAATHWDQPPLVAGHRPDVYATKKGSRRIIEIETDGGDQPDQHEAFRRSAAQRTGTVFYGYVVDAAGRRTTKFD
jgi:hypothetical protein